MTNTLKPTHTLTVARAIKDAHVKAVRSEIDPGLHSVDFAARFSGNLSVGLPTLQRQQYGVLVADAITILLQSPKSRDMALRALAEAAEHARNGLKSEVSPDVIAITEGLPKIEKSGPVSFSGVIEEITRRAKK